MAKSKNLFDYIMLDVLNTKFLFWNHRYIDKIRWIQWNRSSTKETKYVK